jgi:ATP-dependent RNA helicase DeaD
MQLPSVDAVNEKRVAKFLGKIGGALESSDLSVFRELVERYEREHNVPAVEIAAALAQLVQGKTPLLLEPAPERPKAAYEQRTPHDRPGRTPPGRAGRFGDDRPPRAGGEPGKSQPERRPAGHTPRPHVTEAGAPAAHKSRPPRLDVNTGEAMFAGEEAPVARRAGKTADQPEVGMETFRIEVGHQHGVQPGNIVGAIANEADLESRYIGRIDIRDDHSLVDLPEGMPRELLEILKKARVAGRPLRMSRADGADAKGPRGAGARRPFVGKPHARKPGPGPGKGQR